AALALLLLVALVLVHRNSPVWPRFKNGSGKAAVPATGALTRADRVCRHGVTTEAAISCRAGDTFGSDLSPGARPGGSRVGTWNPANRRRRRRRDRGECPDSEYPHHHGGGIGDACRNHYSRLGGSAGLLRAICQGLCRRPPIRQPARRERRREWH